MYIKMYTEIYIYNVNKNDIHIYIYMVRHFKTYIYMEALFLVGECFERRQLGF